MEATKTPEIENIPVVGGHAAAVEIAADYMTEADVFDALARYTYGRGWEVRVIYYAA